MVYLLRLRPIYRLYSLLFACATGDVYMNCEFLCRLQYSRVLSYRSAFLYVFVFFLHKTRENVFGNRDRARCARMCDQLNCVQYNIVIKQNWPKTAFLFQFVVSISSSATAACVDCVHSLYGHFHCSIVRRARFYVHTILNERGAVSIQLAMATRIYGVCCLLANRWMKWKI